MKNKIIYLIRHGEIDNPRQIIYGSIIEMQLNSEGRTQIKSLALRILKSEAVPAKIYTSDLQRALETANILAKIWGVLDVEKEVGLRDSNVPVFTGRPIADIKKIHNQGIDEYSEKFVRQGDESRKDITRRMFKIWKKAVSQNRDCLAIVSHGDPIRFLLYRLENPDSSIIPGMNILTKVDYLPKGCAWKFSVSKQGNLLAKEIIKPD